MQFGWLRAGAFCASITLSFLVLFCALSNVGFCTDSTVYMFSYFSGTTTDGADGLHLAYSLDGLSYHAVNNNAGIVKDTQSTPVMRDPYVTYCADGIYRLVYTTGRGGAWGTTICSTIGYSESTDLLHWSTPTSITLPITNGEERWAPQIYYDSEKSQYMLYWSTRVGTTGQLDMYYSTTKDFKTFSTPTILFNGTLDHALDGDIVKVGDTYEMFLAGYKTSTSLSVGGTNLYSGYSTSQTQLTSGKASEGPSAININGTWIVYNDRYNDGIYSALISTDGLQTFTDATMSVSFPSGTRHGNVFTTTSSVAQALAVGTTYTMPEIEFTGTAANADFSTASNWFGGLTPTGSQTPVIQLGRTVVMSKSPSGTFSNLYVGQTGSGALTINGTAKVVVSGNIFLGSNALGCGTITQAGSSSVTANYYVSIGRYGTGTYRIQSGSFNVINNDFNIGDILGSNGSLVVEGGSVTASQFYVGSGYANGWTDGDAVGAVMQSGGTMAVSGSADVIIGGRNTATGSGCGVGTYNISGGVFNPGSCGVFVGGYGTGTVNQSGGTFNAKQALVIGRYSMSTGTYAICGGTLSQSSTSYRLTVGGSGAGTLTVSGSGLVDAAGGVRLSNSSASTGTLNLDGGTLQTTSITDGGGTSKLNFNGGTLKAKSSTTSFLSGLDGAYVQAGGAKFDTNGYNVTVGQSLLTGVGSGVDGGLTKSGSGTLTLTGNLTYTGATQINAGQITVAGTCTFSSVVGASGTLALGTNAVVTVGTLVADSLIIGATVSAATSSAEAVPEPATIIVLLAVAVCGAYRFRRR